jgi:adenine-specific DNA glycosylase
LVLTKQEICLGGTTNPYAIWLSKSCQQTRVAQGTPYFSFQLHFPTVLIWLTNEEEGVKTVAGLGYYRARNLHKTIRSLELAGVFPR